MKNEELGRGRGAAPFVLSFRPALARRRFRFAYIPLRGSVLSFRFSELLRVTATLSRQNGMEVALSSLQGVMLLAQRSVQWLTSCD